MRNYYRLRLGAGGEHAAACFAGGFVGVDYGVREDLSARLHEQWKDFSREYMPIYLASRPGKSRVAAGLALGAIWTVSKGMVQGDIVLCPDRDGRVNVGEVTGGYAYAPGEVLLHRRSVRWLGRVIDKVEMSEALRAAVNVPLAAVWLNKHAAELEQLLGSAAPSSIRSSGIGGAAGAPDGPEVEDPVAFAMEKHLEDFLVANWAQTELGRDYEVYVDEGERVGQQYPTDTGPIDILAVSKDKKRLLVVELKRGKASDAVVGQILRYMGYVSEELAEPDQAVRGVIIALEDDNRLRRALSMTDGIEFYRYEVSFRLQRVSGAAMA